MHAHADRTRMAENLSGQFFFLSGPRKHRQLDRRASFFHIDRLSEHIQCACRQDLLRGKGDLLAGHIVQITGDLRDPALLRGRFRRARRTALLRSHAAHRKRFAQHHAHAICLCEIFCTHTVTGFCDRHRRHRSELVRKGLKQRRTRRRAKLSLHTAAVDRHTGQDQRRRRRRNRQSAVRAPNGPAADMDR